MAGVEVVAHAWKEWGLQVLVLLSLSLQVMLLVLADFRRRTDSAVLKLFVWSAYLLTDATAIYVLGHMSVTDMSPKHELIAFWAPFLLLHLGGQDNITAYAIEDNKLWLRHLQTLALQAAATAYVLYQSPTISLLRTASILMFVVGVAKYGERVWALSRADITPSINKYRPVESRLRTDASHGPSIQRRDAEALLMIAHLLMDIPKGFLRELPFIGAYYSRTSSLFGEELWKVVEMQVSLLHDVFYTKAEVMHTWYGLCIRIVSTVATAVAFSLVLIVLGDSRSKKRYNRVDVGITYALLAGALFLELMSLLRAMFSSRNSAVLLKWSFNDKGEEERNVWNFLGGIVASIRRFIHAAEWRMLWSSSMGQHNLLQLCARSRTSRGSKIARWMGFEDRWNMLVSSWSIPIMPSVKQLLMKLMSGEGQNPFQLSISDGPSLALESRGLHEELAWSFKKIDKLDLVKTILTWHIATNIYLCWYKEEHAKAGTSGQDDAQQRFHTEAIEAISNYMLFLLASRSSVVSRSREEYVNMCYCLTGLKYSSTEDLAILLRRHGDASNNESHFISFAEDRRDSIQENVQLWNGVRLGNTLIGKDQLEGSTTGGMLELIADMWVELLFCMAGYSDSDEHARQLSHGGELITIAVFLLLYLWRGMINDRFSGST